MAPLALEPELSAMGSDQLRLRLQEWQAQQDFQKGHKAQNLLQQRNLELRNQLDHIYEQEHLSECHHLQQMERIFNSPKAQAGSLHNQGDQQVLLPLLFPTIPPSMSPFEMHATGYLSPPLTPYPKRFPGPLTNPIGLSPTPPLMASAPLFVLPILPVPEQYQAYDQFLQARQFWLRWHQINSPTELDIFTVC